ncbi:MAG: class II SORL domain-containing protein [Pyramidobacter sp.]|nr:class II SORL domain-containing protein [Pyramidobacter sp.]
MKIIDLVQSGDWKGEKHVPVIEAPASVKAGEVFSVKLCVGAEIAHPNTPEHHIDWIKLYFKPASGKFAVEMAAVNFLVHGDDAAASSGSVSLKLKESGTLIAVSYCNIHGLWESSAEITVE